MSVETLPLLIMTGVTEASEPERMVSQVRQAITLDLVERALTVPSFGPIVVATNSPELSGRLTGYAGRVVVDLDEPGEAFHFGRRLLGLIAHCDADRCFYIGGGAGPLLSSADLAAIAERLLAADRLLINLLRYAARDQQQPLADLPSDFDARSARLAWRSAGDQVLVAVARDEMVREYEDTRRRLCAGAG